MVSIEFCNELLLHFQQKEVKKVEVRSESEKPIIKIIMVLENFPCGLIEPSFACKPVGIHLISADF